MLAIAHFGWLPTMVVVSCLWAKRNVCNRVLAAAAIALLVHLLGAGGIAMPAISQTLLLLLVCVTVPTCRQRINQETNLYELLQ